MNLKERSYKKELLDAVEIAPHHLHQNLHELNIINTWLGGHSVTIAGLKKIIGSRRTVSVCEIGCGGGDNLKALHNWCSKNNIVATFIGIDLKKDCIDFAQQHHCLPNVSWLHSDYKKVQFTSPPDIIFSSLFCHHFTNPQIIEQLLWMHTNSTVGFFINDLQRNSIAYVLIKRLTRLFSKSHLVKHDAPLSVARGFTKKEWINLIAEAQTHCCMVQWKWAFRFLITCRQS